MARVKRVLGCHAVRMIEEMFVQLLILLDHRGDIEMRFCTVRCGGPHSAPSIGALEKERHGVREAGGVAAFLEETFLTVRKKTRHATNGGADNWESRCHGFHDRERITFPI